MNQELKEAREQLIERLQSLIPKDDLDFLKGPCVTEIIKELKTNNWCLLLGEYRYQAYDNNSSELALVKAILLKTALEKKGLKVEILNPEPPKLYRTRTNFRTLIITGWVE